MVENVNTKTQKNEIKGKLVYEDKVIQKIIGMALDSVDGLLAVDGGFFSNLTDKLINTDNVTTGVSVEVGQKQVAVDLKIIAEYEKNIPKIYEEIKKIISDEVAHMTDLDVIEVNVDVIDVKTKAQQEADEVSVQDRITQATQSSEASLNTTKSEEKDKTQRVK
ncbi:Asp23/Gls24 family envelope stress response protein [Lactococcus hircilactis]|uniref:Stress response regulator gls24 homolog n=1 Tax=Lactococcus hircilactis TaxID=1494462 RepID=A0A7X2D315_9LACT|nr:Asp23/Gls24 family envelope stress response protein [Lactococcus hircilactis]MQW40690.1 Asp23/Gls24 family envelope stress response protein [Lactococcus hircilactis]